jgi:DMSO/TMAO reductase YedYZ molybdopterin-dependent catalytic subunit
VDLSTWRLKVGGHLDKPFDISLDDLQNKLSPKIETFFIATLASLAIAANESHEPPRFT